MKTTLEFDDSEVGRIESDGAALTVRFSAAHVRGFDERADTEGGSGYAQPLAMQFNEAAWQGAIGECIGRLADGKVVVDGVARSSLELPVACTGAIIVELEFKNGARLRVNARSLSCRFTKETKFVEDFRC